MRKYKPNPPWADQMIERHYLDLAAYAGEEAMPRKVEAFDHWAEYGCGVFGCVYPTSLPGIVFKITRDVSEAAFVAAAIKLGEWPDGMVRYFGVAEVAPPDKWSSGARERRFARYFVMWREEAFDVGRVRTFDDSHIRLIGNAGFGVRTELERAGDVYEQKSLLRRAVPVRAEMRAEAERFVSKYITLADALWQILDHNRSPLTQVAYDIELAFVRAKEAIEQGGDAGRIAETLMFYMNKGFLLSDIHTGNVGLVQRVGTRQIVITDPGVMIPFSPDTVEVKVDMLAAPKGESSYELPRILANASRRRQR